MRFSYRILTFILLLSSLFTLNSCELFEDILDDHKKSKRDHFIGVWQNDSLTTRIFSYGEITSSSTQSLQGNTFEMRKDGTYTTANPNGEVYLNGTWELVRTDKQYQILLDKGTSLERSYDVNVITKNRLVTNDKVAIDENSYYDYTFSYHK